MSGLSMFAVGIPIFFLMSIVPGFLILRLLRVKKLDYLDALLYSVGLSFLFNTLAGMVSNFTLGVRLVPVAAIYGALVAILAVLSFKLGRKFSLDWGGDKKLLGVLVPVGLFFFAAILQYQTTLISPNLVGSDIHYEFYHASLTLENGFWDAMQTSTPVGSCIGVTLLLPVYSLLTGIDILWIFKAVAPLMFAVLPLVLYRIFKMQFGTLVAVLSVVFFVAMPMFTMDLVQLVRQQQSELFFVLVVLLLMDDNLRVTQKIGLGIVFGFGTIATHYGLAVGYTGYMLMSAVIVVILARVWRKKRKIADVAKPMKTRLILVALAVIAVGSYFAYYDWVGEGKYARLAQIPGGVLEVTANQIMTGGPEAQAAARVAAEAEEAKAKGEETGVGESPAETPTQSSTQMPSNSESQKPDETVSSVPKAGATSATASGISLVQRLAPLNPFTKEPLLQTAIGLDFMKASALGKIWRILQYLVEICLVVGFFRLLLRPPPKVRMEYIGFVLTSFFIVIGLYFLQTRGYGLGGMRILGIALLFMVPLFVLGIGTIGNWLAGLFRRMPKRSNVLLVGMLALFVPYYFFNSGVPFELTKRDSGSFVDIPYSIALSGHRVDLASIFEEEDIEAADWLKEYTTATVDNPVVIYTDYHGFLLMHQKFDNRVVLCEMVNKMKSTSEGYIFLRKWSVDNNKVTFPGGYGCRVSYDIGEMEVLKEKMQGSGILYNDGAMILLIEPVSEK